MKKQKLRNILAATLDATTDFFYGQKKQTDGTFKTVKFAPPSSPDSIENGAFTLSADGFAATGGTLNRISTAGAITEVQPVINGTGNGYVVGDILTLSEGDGNATVRVTSINVSTGEITGIDIVNPGTGYTVDGIGNNSLTTGGSGNGYALMHVSAVGLETVVELTVTTAKKLKLLNDIKLFDLVTPGGDFGKPSSINGVSDVTIQSCFDTYNYVLDPVNCVNATDNTNGWTGLITSITDTTIVFTLTQKGSGLDVTGQWIATTGNN